MKVLTGREPYFFSKGERVGKREACLNAIMTIGIDATWVEALSFIRTEYNLSEHAEPMSKTCFKKVKMAQLKAAKTLLVTMIKHSMRQQTAAQQTQATTSMKPGHVSMQALEAAKTLVTLTVSREEAKQLIDLLS